MYLITNGLIICEDEIKEGYDILVDKDIILRIVKEGEIDTDDIEVIDAKGGYIMPGLIDIHSDYIENMAAPRPTTLMDFELSIRETEKVLLSNGITTMFHSLSLYNKDEFDSKPVRKAENVKKVVELINDTHNTKHLIRNRFHARFEIDNVNGIDGLKEYINNDKVHLVSFMDHTPGQGQYRDLEIYRKTLKGYKGISDEEVDRVIKESANKEKVTIDILEEIAELAREKNIAIASHDDDCIEKIDFISGLGARISEFPITLDVAYEAKKRGMLTVAGAPNVMLGGSHSGNMSAAEAISQGVVDILCSDYYPAAMLHSIFKLNNDCNLELLDLVKLVTLNPAKAVNMDDMLGSIKEGKKADILVVEKIEGGFPAITKVLVDGKLVMSTNYRV